MLVLLGLNTKTNSLQVRTKIKWIKFHWNPFSISCTILLGNRQNHNSERSNLYTLESVLVLFLFWEMQTPCRPTTKTQLSFPFSTKTLNWTKSYIVNLSTFKLNRNISSWTTFYPFFFLVLIQAKGFHKIAPSMINSVAKKDPSCYCYEFCESKL